ncbi:MAG: tRNA (adenosine(37)-N6)-threonylcarbamoyltransferase complex dimerization subunit type 1 TsaB [Candidatus Omnitrophica bacterium]|nr:tRNA (adenosine(37)-N6)-threonylcarbamoyltransferase complex dimerization subunit type 1 TsaB [Candidatus Omnitrophota bacterium]
MKVLAFDTSTKYLTIALLEGGQVVSEYHEEAGILHSKILITAVDGVLRSAGCGIKEIELVCVGTGPGSFTGLRIASATVKGFAAVTGVKVKGVPTIDAIALRPGIENVRVAPLLDARKGKVYSCFYRILDGELIRLSDYMLLTIKDLASMIEHETVFLGDGLESYGDHLRGVTSAIPRRDLDWYPRASDIGMLGIRMSRDGYDAPEDLEPMYLHSRECNITVPGKKQIDLESGD